MNSNITVGNRIKSLRESKSITIEQLAEQTGLAVEQIKCIEEGIVI
jgi:cytoskeletal protein RodZ